PRRAGPEGDESVSPARVSVRVEARGGFRDRGRGREPVPRPERRDRRHVDGPLPPAGRRGDPAAGREADPLLGERLLPADLYGGLRAPRPDRADVPAGAELPDELRNGRRGGGDQARALRDRAAVHRRVLQLLPREVVWKRLRDREQVALTVELRSYSPR